MAKKTASSRSATKTHKHGEQQLRSMLLMGAAFIVVMLIAFGYRESNNSRYQARVYDPVPAASIPKTAQPSSAMSEGGACCAMGECLDLTRSECTSASYVYWPDADLCLTACPVTR